MEDKKEKKKTPWRVRVTRWLIIAMLIMMILSSIAPYMI